MPNKSILSILSHVVHGYVGNRATVFPLQYAGWDVDAINTTNYLNHPGYGTFAGSATTPELVEKILVGLKAILDFKLNYDLILTGYTPNEKVLSVVFEQLVAVFELGTLPGKPTWIVDPVLGDNGRFYVLENVVPEYHKFFSSGYVSLITPNQFEMEILSGVKITDWESVNLALEKFNEKFSVANIVISSVTIDGKMYTVGSPADGEVFYLPIAEIPSSFNGCGDLFVGLLANTFHEGGLELTPEVVGGVLYRLHRILEYSYKQELLINPDAKVVKNLRIVQLREHLLETVPATFEVGYIR